MAMAGKIYQRKIQFFRIILVLNLVYVDFAKVFGGSLERNSKKPDLTKYSHHIVVETYFENRRKMSTSNLGSILFKNVEPLVFENKLRQSRKYTVVVWMFWTDIVATYLHTDNFDSQSVTNKIMESCSVKNCEYLSSYYTNIESADAVIFDMKRNVFPHNPKRNLNQRWILWHQGSPIHTPTKLSYSALAALSGVFNWTMSYRSDTDIPVPYGRTVPLPSAVADVSLDNPKAALEKLVPYWREKQTNILAMALVSNCNWQYTMFTDEMDVDIFWKSCQIVSNSDCILPEKYLFFLAFEGASCRQYLTETVFYLAYAKGAIPVIMGPPLEDCVKLLPPNSFLHVDRYKSLPELVLHMKSIASSEANLLDFHIWRRCFKVENEHGFFDTTSQHLCRVCEALNYNDGEVSTYNLDDLHLFFNEKLFCDMEYKCNAV